MQCRGWLVVAWFLVAALVAGPSYAAPSRDLPPAGTDFDYQPGGNRPVPDRVGIVVRDREAAPADGLYNVCYVNGFQTQASEKRFWRERWGLVLKRDGEPVVDEGWGEWLLDIRTDAKRKRLARIVGRWISGCADDGYDAVELDNLDSFSRSRRLITRDATKKYAAKLVRRAHRAGLAAAQKNMAGWDGTRVGFDFAIAEDCARWRECGSYVDHYGDLVVRRDLELSADGVRRWC